MTIAFAIWITAVTYKRPIVQIHQYNSYPAVRIKQHNNTKVLNSSSERSVPIAILLVLPSVFEYYSNIYSFANPSWTQADRNSC